MYLQEPPPSSAKIVTSLADAFQMQCSTLLAYVTHEFTVSHCIPYVLQKENFLVLFVVIVFKQIYFS
jgi:hypothetical protein